MRAERRPRGVLARVGACTAVAITLLSACTTPRIPSGSSAATTVRPATTTSTSEAPTTSAPPPAFEATVAPIDSATASRMSASWRPGCPVGLADLRLVTLTHWGFDGAVRRGELVVHRDHADAVVRVFDDLFASRFPVEQVRLVDEFGGDDDRSMAANNTSGFNCRTASGSDRWSEHAYGAAVDINPIQNPYVSSGGAVLPPAGAAHTARDGGTPGLITADGPVVAAFAAIGWSWGGAWRSAKDYQHFSASGR